MAVAGAVAGDKAQQLAFVKLDCLAGGEIIRNQNGGLIVLHSGVTLAGKDIDYPPGNVFDIGCPSLHIGILHGGKGSGKVLAGSLGGVFSSGSLGVDDTLDGIQIVLVLQHHPVDLKNGGVVLAHFLQSPLI